MRQLTKQMPIVHHQVAGIDIGSKSHSVAIGDDPKLHVREFGVATPQLFELAQWLLDHQIQHVAMEATGGYERPLVNILQEVGLTITVTAGVNTKNYRRIKTDTADAIHIRTLHQLGLLPPCFVADQLAATIRPLVRLRRNLIEQASTAAADRPYPIHSEGPAGGQRAARQRADQHQDRFGHGPHQGHV